MFSRIRANASKHHVRFFSDFRSDTVTIPSQRMRESMLNCLVGDDVMNEDPTVRKLEQIVAEMLGKDDSVFVPSGTMANLLAIMVHCSHRSTEMIVGDQSHIFMYEQGGGSCLAGVHVRPIPNELDGTISLGNISKAIRGNDPHYPRTQLLCLENTHNRCGGRVLSPEYIKSVSKILKTSGDGSISFHIDGARLWNAANFLGVPIDQLVSHVDSVSVCFSKGLGCPAGSLLVGEQSFVDEARYLRKGLGGGMRQVGVLAAPCVVSLDEILPKIGESHSLAKELAQGFSKIHGVSVNVGSIETNLLMLHLDEDLPIDAGEMCRELSQLNVKASEFDERVIRFATHHQVSRTDVDNAIEAVKKVIDQSRK